MIVEFCRSANGAVVDATGTIVDPPFEIPTTTDGDQDSPSVTALGSAFAVAWDDASSATPHAAVRARVIYPPFAGD